ncbi:MAG TPA: SpoIIE family protein phosphatase, partial [Polyangiaceae bacterium]|nr:SpoIIE family protein phosphatase [Polyangiaceae bacterium]
DLEGSVNGGLPEPRDIVMLTHAELVRRLSELESFVTLAYARLDAIERRLELVDCGHTGLLHWRAKTGRCDVLHGDNLPLGVLEGEVYNQTVVPFEPGDLLLFFSDGITEARNARKELFGVERLEACLESHADLAPAALVEAIRGEVVEFARSNALSDDLTAVALRVEEWQPAVAQAELEISSELERLHEVREFVRRFCSSLPGGAMDDESIGALELAVNEAASNIVKHAYQGRSEQKIQLEAEAFPSHVCMRLHHFGPTFDASAVPAPAFDGSRDSGFGVYMISRSVDGVRYHRDARGRNCISLIKHRKQRANAAAPQR